VNAIVRSTPLRAYPGWIVRQYAKGQFDAAQIVGVQISPGFTTFGAAVAYVREATR
jgi:hypothetical protein